MYKLYAVNNHKKSDVKGLWKSKGNLYIDNIYITEYKTKHTLKRGIDSLFNLGEKAVFYTSESQGYMVNKTGGIDVLKHKRVYHRQKLSASEVKGIINEFGGLTIHKRADGYIIEVYYNYNIKGKK